MYTQTQLIEYLHCKPLAQQHTPKKQDRHTLLTCAEATAACRAATAHHTAYVSKSTAGGRHVKRPVRVLSMLSLKFCGVMVVVNVTYG